MRSVSRQDIIDHELDRIAKAAQDQAYDPSKSHFETTSPQRRDSLEEEQNKVLSDLPSTGRSSRSAVISRALDEMEVKFHISTGLRRDDLKWNFAHPSGTPNILSELTWKNLTSFQLGGKADLLWRKAFLLEGSLDYGWITNGKNQDSDYVSDDRQGEFSRSNNSSDGDNVLDTQIGAGYQFRLPVIEDWKEFLTDDLWMAVLSGYSYHQQNLRLTDGFQTIPATGPFAGLNSTYQSEWEGPWLGIELSGTRENFQGYTRMEYHWADFYGVGDWNLRDDRAHPKSFEQWSHGHGLVFDFGGELAFNSDWEFGLRFKIQSWQAKSGTHQNNFSDGTKTQMSFNSALWQSYAGMLSATYHFPLGKSWKEKAREAQGTADLK